MAPQSCFSDLPERFDTLKQSTTGIFFCIVSQDPSTSRKHRKQRYASSLSSDSAGLDYAPDPAFLSSQVSSACWSLSMLQEAEISLGSYQHRLILLECELVASPPKQVMTFCHFCEISSIDSSSLLP